MINENLYTRKEAANIFHVTELSVWRWIKAGKVRAVKIGRSYRITETEIKRVLSDGTRIMEKLA